MNRATNRVWFIALPLCVLIFAIYLSIAYFFLPSIQVAFQAGRLHRSFYIPAASMLPTLEINDRILPLALSTVALRRGQILIFRSGSQMRVDRIVGLGGDIVSLRGGTVTVNGEAATVRKIGRGPQLDGTTTTIFAERLPGENHWHRILDSGLSDQDDFAAVRVPDGALFLLGDNRDRAADSRFPAKEMGVGMVPMSDVIGIVDTLLWSKQRERIGQSIDTWAGFP